MQIQTKSVELTEGSIPKLMLRFALPILLGQVFQNLYNSADSIVVGQFCGTHALAAVSACSAISRLLTGFFAGLSIGTGVLIARFFGAKDYKKLHDSIHTALLFAIILGTLMATLGVLCAPFLLRATDCPEEVYLPALQYLRIYLVGVLFTAMYNVGAGILRAVGDAKTPLYYLIISSVINIAVDLLAVAWLNMGVIGVALATVVSQLCSMLLVYATLMRTDDVHRVHLSHLMIDRKLLGQLIDLGIPTAIQNSLNALSDVFVQKYINGFQSAAIAGIGAAKRLDHFVALVALSVGNAETMFVSQNIGAQKTGRAIKGIYVSLAITLVFSTCVSIPGYIFAPSLVKIFNGSPEVLNYGVGMMRVMMPLYCLQGLSHIYACAIRGFGHSRTIMLLNLFSLVIVKQIFLAVALNLVHDVRSIYWCYPLSWAVASVLNIAFFFVFIKKRLPKQKIGA
ncbi:MAG: MATE family efflux transporter [Oscillospiraceae bacterium]|nr:MATE family efflux transporter [Oscillospiraceae bacterium]